MNEAIHPLARKTVVWHLAVTSLVLILMMIFGVIMLMNQGEMISITPQWFYKIMTAHGQAWSASLHWEERPSYGTSCLNT